MIDIKKVNYCYNADSRYYQYRNSINYRSTAVSDLCKQGNGHGQYLLAASALKNIMAIYNDTNELTNAPGPLGLEGSYPVRLSRKGAEIALPEGISLEQARDLNCQAQQYDGIQEIKDNGDIQLTDEASATLKEVLDVDCKVVTIEDSFDQAIELRTKFQEFARKHGVNVPQ